VPALIWQFGTFGIMILTGLALGVLFDVYRVIRSLIKQGSLSAMLMDLFFWLLATPATFIMLLIGNWGELRLYVFLGIALGLFAYFQLVSPLVLWALVTWLRWIGRLTAGAVFHIVRALGVPWRLGRLLARCRVFRPQPPAWFSALISGSGIAGSGGSGANDSGSGSTSPWPLISTRAGYFFRRPPWAGQTWHSVITQWWRWRHLE